MKKRKEEMRKITVNIPSSLIDSLITKEKGQTEVICEALRRYKAHRAYEALEALRGKVDFLLTYEEIKELR